MTTGEHILNAALRAVGRLVTKGVITRELAAAIIRDTWCRAAADVLPAGATLSSNEVLGMRVAEANQFWCESCPADEFPHRVTFKGEKCPGCKDDEKRDERLRAKWGAA